MERSLPTRGITIMKQCALLSVILLSLAACDSPEEKFEKYIQRGATLVEKGELKKARLEYKNAARIKPTDPAIFYRLAQVDEAEGNLQNAFKLYVGAEQQNARYAPALNKLAQYFMAGESLTEAQKRLTIVLEDDPKNAEAHALTAALASRRNDATAVEKSAQLALSYDPKNVTAYTVLASFYANQNKLDQAEALLAQGVEKVPNSVPLRLLQALVFDKAKKTDQIVETYRKIIAIKPNHYGHRVELAGILAKLDKKDEAERVYQQALKDLPEEIELKKKYVDFLDKNFGLDRTETVVKAMMPDQSDWVFLLADLYARNKRADRAIDLLKSIVADSSKMRDEALGLNARTSLAQLQLLKGDRALAESLVKTVLESSPSDRQALLIRAQLSFERGATQDAVSDLRSVQRERPKDLDVLLLLSEVLLAQGYIDLAIDTMNQTVDVAPSHLPARIRLAQLYLAQGNPRYARDIVQQVTTIDPAYGIGWETAARVALALNDAALIQSALEKLDTMPVFAGSAAFLRGQWAVIQKQPDQALAFYQKALQGDPRSPLASHVLPALVELLLSTKKFDQATSFLQSLSPQTSFVLTLSGQVALAQNRTEEAASFFDKAIESEDRGVDQTPFIARAQLLARQGEFDKALALVKRANEAFPQDPRASMMMADLLVTAKRPLEALTVYEQLVARNIKTDIPVNNMAQLVADYMPHDREKMEKARQGAERFVNSQNPIFLDTLGWVYHRMGMLPQAQTVYERVLTVSQSPSPQFCYHYGLLFHQKGQMDLARDYLKKAVAGQDDYFGKDDAVRLLKEIR